MSDPAEVLDQVSAAEESTHDTLLAVFNKLLDTYYEKHPGANAFGTDYDAPNGTPDGVWYIGREDGADGSENDCGVDFLYRKSPPRGRDQETEYILGKYGWTDAGSLLDEADFLRQMLEEAVEQEFLDEGDLERFDEAIDSLDAALYNARHDISLEEIEELVLDYDIDALRPLLVTGDEEGRVTWQMLFSKDEDDETIKNEVEVPVNDGNMMLVRSERYFQHDRREPDGKWYAYGVVIGIDDTDERFFVHRLNSDPGLRDPEFEWTIGAVRDKMGFDVDYDEIADITDDIPLDTAARVQGDVALIRRDYRTALWEHYEDVLENHYQNLVAEHMPNTFSDDETTLSSRLKEDFGDVDGIYVGTRNARVRVRLDDTDELKELQERLDIDEESVREEQEKRGIQRLSAKRRGEIVEDLLSERIRSWVREMEGGTEEDVQEAAEQEACEQFEDTDKQVNLVLGNHTLIISNAREHPSREYTRENDCLAAVVVPEEATCMVWHDEHDNKKATLPQGVYEFRFLEGHEDQWWMDN